MPKKTSFTPYDEIPVVGTVPGLGCPHCKWAGYTVQDRTDHIRQEHPGEFAGPTADMLMVMGRRGGMSDVDPFTARRMKKMQEEGY